MLRSKFMIKPRYCTIFAVFFLVGSVIFVACGGSKDNPLTPEVQKKSSNTHLVGTIQIDGSSTVFPISQAVAEEFRKDFPKVQVVVGISGTGGGFKRFTIGEIDISNASRPIREKERTKASKNGIEFIPLKVAFDGLSVLVNKKNDFVECLTTNELNSIWEPDSNLSNWNQVRAGFPDRPLKLYGPGTDSGTFDYFTDEINGEEGASRPDYIASEDDNVLVRGISGDKGALGYFGFAYYVENKDKLKLVGIDGGNGCVKPSPETINNGSYAPLSRPMFIYVNRSSLEKEEVFEFIKYYMENGALLANSTGYVELPENLYKEGLSEIGVE